jgi:hypothetical protein
MALPYRILEPADWSQQARSTPSLRYPSPNQVRVSSPFVLLQPRFHLVKIQGIRKRFMSCHRSVDGVVYDHELPVPRVPRGSAALFLQSVASTDLQNILNSTDVAISYCRPEART